MMNKKTSKGKILMAMGLLLIGASISLVIYNLWQEQQAGAISNKILEQMNYVEAEKEENIELEEKKKKKLYLVIY